ncbi:MAG: PhnD/SsuA/transferrin family substrate-binding protein [Candidatus Binatia bacterium]
MRQIALMFAAFLVCTPTPVQAEQASLFFFSPDWAPGNLNLLSETVSAVAEDNNVRLSFQAFARYEDFCSQLELDRPDFVVVPHWATTVDGCITELVPLAVPLRQGRDWYQKALMAGDGIADVSDLASGTIAAAVAPEGPQDRYAIIEHFGLGDSEARIIPVPKDIDALLALSFGQVDAALVTTTQFEMLSAVNPNSTKGLKVLGLTPKLPFPVLYATAGTSPELVAVMRAGLQRVRDTLSDQSVLELLGFDGMRIVTPPRSGGSRIMGNGSLEYGVNK